MFKIGDNVIVYSVAFGRECGGGIVTISNITEEGIVEIESDNLKFKNNKCKINRNREAYIKEITEENIKRHITIPACKNYLECCAWGREDGELILKIVDLIKEYKQIEEI